MTGARPRVGVNLLWLVPGVVGGSEEYTVGLLTALAESAPPDVELTLFVNDDLAAAHPDLVAALTEQAGRVWHVSNLYQIPEQQRLADLICGATFADTAFFTNSGTEAAELAIKMVRKPM